MTAYCLDGPCAGERYDVAYPLLAFRLPVKLTAHTDFPTAQYDLASRETDTLALYRYRTP